LLFVGNVTVNAPVDPVFPVGQQEGVLYFLLLLFRSIS